jgi:superfamily II DNA or RNA helicase
MRNRAHAVVFDEAHRALAPSFLSVIEFLTEKGAPLAGLSATPGRGVVDREQENKDLASIFDERLVEPSSEGEILADLQDQGILAVVRRREVETGVEIYPSEKDFEDAHLGFEYGRVVLATLAKNLKRNNLIIETVLEEIQDNRPVLLFACSVSHAQILAAALNLHGVSSACVHGEMARLDRSHVVEGFRAGKFDVLTNFGVLTTGFDAPRTRTVIVARPTSSAVLYAQMIGRALRGPKMGGGEEAWVVDVRDNLERFGAVANVYQAFERFWGE